MKRLFALPLSAALSMLPVVSQAQPTSQAPGQAQQAPQRELTPAEQRAKLKKDVAEVVATLRRTDPEIERFFKTSAGYVVFPVVGKAGFIVGGGHGDGELFEKGRVAGTASLTVASFGLQFGVQEFAQAIFFEDAAALGRFKGNKFEISAAVSAVILKAGAAKSANYRDGVAVFTLPKAGAMAEIALGAQKFNYKPD